MLRERGFQKYSICSRKCRRKYELRPSYKSHTIFDGKYNLQGLPAVYASEEESQTLEILMEDPVTGVKVVLLYGVLPAQDIITRSVCVKMKAVAKSI